jgi:hypothetical protein
MRKKAEREEIERKRAKLHEKLFLASRLECKTMQRSLMNFEVEHEWQRT